MLSGGGAKAAAHCGAVRALRERGIEPTRYVATSMGAVVAAALAAGAEPDTVVRALMNEAPAGIRPHPLAAVAGIHLEAGSCAALPRGDRALIPARTFAELKVPLTVTAVDVDKLETGALRAWRRRRAAARRAGRLLRAAALLPGGVARWPACCETAALMGRAPAGGRRRDRWTPVIAVDVGPGIRQRARARPPGGPPLVRAVRRGDRHPHGAAHRGPAGPLARGAGRPTPVRAAAGRAQRDVQRRVARGSMPRRGTARCARHSVVLIPWPDPTRLP